MKEARSQTVYVENNIGRVFLSLLVVRNPLNPKHPCLVSVFITSLVFFILRRLESAQTFSSHGRQPEVHILP